MSRKNKLPGVKKWVHPDDALIKGHIVYNTKFLGFVRVDQPKGTDVVKEAIKKMKFHKQIKKSEGVKSPKVELTISVDGVTVQEPKYKVVQHKYPLHRISYCADDKSDKRMFTFIAKASDVNEHYCFVFDSEKCAEEITLTIGQAFDLAYKRFLDSAGRDVDTKKQYLMAQKKIQHLTEENLQLKERVANLERLVDPKILETLDKVTKEQKTSKSTTPSNVSQDVTVGRRLENLVFEEEKKNDNYITPLFNNGNSTAPTSTADSALPRLAPPPPVPARNNIPTSPTQTTKPGVDLFGSEPFTTTNGAASAPMPSTAKVPDPFGMPSFTPQVGQADLDRQIQSVDQELMDLQTGFSQGLSYGTEDFSLDDLDPLKK